MVPHGLIEEQLERLLGPTEDGRPQVAVTAVADPKKGERLVVLHTPLTKTPQELRRGLAEAGLPNLYIPSEDSFLEVPQLPLLGSGKLDLRGVKALAEQRLSRG
jgi:acyl-[acyl-carrier-protein]-phospholipid O-acyltransferase/long-chain-fatty-acid--[acyl-carrier-protein] ligase